MDNNLLNGLNDKDAEIKKIRDEILNRREQEFSKVIEEYVAHRLMVVELEKQAKSSEEKIRRALKAKITRISNLEKAIKEFESKSESEITPEAREKYEKNLREYDRKKNPQNYKARKRSRKSQAVILEETKQKIAEMRETLKADEEKMHLYAAGKSNEDILLGELDGNYRTGYRTEKKENKTESIRVEDDKSEGKREEVKKVEQPSARGDIDKELEQLFSNGLFGIKPEGKRRNLEQETKAIKGNDIEKELGHLFSNGNFGIKPEKNETNSNPFKFTGRHEDFIAKFKNEIENARRKGFNNEEIKNFILTGKTEGMSFMAVRELVLIAGLRDGYEGDKQQLIDELFEEENDKFISFKYRHPKITAIPVIGKLIARIADRREKKKIQKAIDNREKQGNKCEIPDKNDALAQEIRRNFIESLKYNEYYEKNASFPVEAKTTPEVERI